MTAAFYSAPGAHELELHEFEEVSPLDDHKNPGNLREASEVATLIEASNDTITPANVYNDTHVTTEHFKT